MSSRFCCSSGPAPSWTQASSTGSAWPPVAALLAYEHAIVSPGDLRRLNTAFFTLNGVISIVFFVFVLADVTAVIRASGLAKRYGDKRVLQGVDFELPRGGFFLVTGPNGSGKTTLLRLCAGLATPTSGRAGGAPWIAQPSASSATSRSSTRS